MLDQRQRRQPRLDQRALMPGTVAGVEPVGQLAGGTREAVGQRGYRGAAHREAAPAGGHQPAQQQRGRGREVHGRVRRRGALQPVQMPLHDLEPAHLVAGQRAELDVLPDLAEVREVAPDPAVPAQVRVAGLGQPAGAQVRQEQFGQHGVRLLGAGQPAGQHRCGERDGLLVAPAAGQVLDLGRRVAAAAVGVLVARGGAPAHVPVLGRLGVADVVRQPPAQHVHGVHAVPAEAVPALHVVQYRVRARKRYLRELAQPGDDPLEVPAEQLVVPHVEAGRVAVVLRQAPREGDEPFRGFAAHLVRLGARHPGVEAQPAVVQRVRQPDRLLGEGDLAGPVRRVPSLPDEPPNVLDAHSGPSLRSRPA